MAPSYRGQSLTRLEDARFLTGRGHYIEDVQDDALHLAVLRSPYAHADITELDFSAALALEGVVAVHVGADLLAENVGPLPCNAQFDAVSPLVVPPRHALAQTRVRHVGDAVAFVVARTAEAARGALEHIELVCEPLPAVTDAAAALEAGAPEVWDVAPGNLAYQFEAGDHPSVAATFSSAAHVVSVELNNQRVSALPLETRGGEASYDATTGQWHLHCNAQGLHAVRQQLANNIFQVEPERVRISAPDVGGGFGLKNFLYPEWIMLMWAARRHQAKVRWMADRSEDFLSSAYGRDMRVKARLALDADGRFLALEADAVANMGAYLSGGGPSVSTRAMPTAIGGIYAIPQIALTVRGAFSNTIPTDAYRGAGKPEANYLTERLVEKAARALDIDPFEIRRRNCFNSFPYHTSLGQTIDGGAFGANIERAQAAADSAGFANRKAQAKARGRWLGQGVACFLETSRGAPEEGVAVHCLADGRIELRVGTESQGQGHETAYAQIAADAMQLPLDNFVYVQADTGRVRMGHGHGGARSMHMGGKAVVEALDEVMRKARDGAAGLLQAMADEVTYADGVFRTVSASVSFTEVIAATTQDDECTLNTFSSHHDTPFTFPNGCHVAEVEVDPQTGTVKLIRYVIFDDYGRLINPMLTQGQVVGGVTQGIGQALTEASVYDDEGQLLSASLMDYALPRAVDVPDFDVVLDGPVTTANPLGVKGSGQAGCIAAPQTVVHAVLDAVADAGVTDLDMPLTSHAVWRALAQASS